MHFSLNFSTHPGDLAIIEHEWSQAKHLLIDEGFDGFELYPVGDYPFEQIPPDIMRGIHLSFYPILAPLWRDDRQRLRDIFGDDETIIAFYGGLTRESLLAKYRAQLAIAESLGCGYVVFHLAQSEFEYIYHWQFPWSWRETVNLCAEVLNELFTETNFSGELLLENLWWPGSFRALDAREIAYALRQVAYPRTGIMLDTGHVFNTNQQLDTESDGIAFLLKTVRGLGDMRSAIRGVHLTRSLSADYVTRAHAVPTEVDGSFWDRYHQALDHVRQIDQHDAFTDPAICGLFDLITPDYVTYEFSYASRGEWLGKIRRQRRAMAGVHGD